MRAGIRVGCVLAVGALALAGCSSSDPGTSAASPAPNGIADLPAQQILDTAKKNANAQSSVHLVGKGQCAELGPYNADMRLRSDNTGTGSITTGAGKLTVTSSPGTVYVQGPAEFWTSQISATAAAQIGSKWVALPAASNTCIAALGSFTDVLANFVALSHTPTKEKSTTVGGVPAQLLTMPPDVSYWVASTGLPLPIYISSVGVELAMALTQWGEPVDVSLPAGNDVLQPGAIAK